MEFLSSIIDYIRVLRPKNLIIIAITQILIHYWVIVPKSTFIVLSGGLLPLFILDTIFIAAGGYLINDIIDEKADSINKPTQRHIGQTISSKSAYIYYICLIIAGGILSAYIAQRTDNWSYFWIYPASSISMYIYSRYLKSTVLTGNIYVSAVLSFVLGSVWLAQSTHYPNDSHQLSLIFTIYMIFIFLINLIREITKDVEDIDGDRTAGYITLPIKLGVGFTKGTLVALYIVFFIILIIIYYSYQNVFNYIYITFMVVFVSLPLAVSLYLTLKAKEKSNFSKISSFLKIIMLSGMISIFLIP